MTLFKMAVYFYTFVDCHYIQTTIARQIHIQRTMAPFRTHAHAFAKLNHYGFLHVEYHVIYMV